MGIPDFPNALPIPVDMPADAPHLLAFYHPTVRGYLIGLLDTIRDGRNWDNSDGNDEDVLTYIEAVIDQIMGATELPGTLTILNEDGEINAFVVKDGRIVLESGERLLINTPQNAAGIHLFNFTETQARLYFFGNTFEVMTPDGRRKFFVSNNGIVEVNNTSTNGNTQLIIRANANIENWSPLVVHTKQVSFEVTENGAVKAYQALFLLDKTATQTREAVKFQGFWYDQTDASRKSEAAIVLQDANGTYAAFNARSNAGDILLSFRDKPPVEAPTITGDVNAGSVTQQIVQALAEIGLITDATNEV